MTPRSPVYVENYMRNFICFTCSERYTEIELDNNGSICEVCGATGFKQIEEDDEDETDT